VVEQRSVVVAMAVAVQQWPMAAVQQRAVVVPVAHKRVAVASAA